MTFSLPAAASVAQNPTQEEMRAWVMEYMARVTETEYGNLNYQAEVTARLSRSTFFVSDVENFQNRISRPSMRSGLLARTRISPIRT